MSFQRRQFQSLFVETYLANTVAVTGSIPPNSWVDFNAVIPGAEAGDLVLWTVEWTSDEIEDLQYLAGVSKPNVVTVRVTNPTGSAVNPGTVQGILIIGKMTEEERDTLLFATPVARSGNWA